MSVVVESCAIDVKIKVSTSDKFVVGHLNLFDSLTPTKSLSLLSS